MSKALWKFTRLVSLAAVVSSASLADDFFLHGTAASPSNLFIDRTAPTGSTAKYRDSAAVNFNRGNPWKEIGWWTATPANSSGTLTALGTFQSWVGLQNSDDQGTRFDLRVEVYKTTSPDQYGETYCIQNVTRNENSAVKRRCLFLPSHSTAPAISCDPLVGTTASSTATCSAAFPTSVSRILAAASW